MKRIIYYLTKNYNEYELKVYNSFASHIHFGIFSFNNNEIYLNNSLPFNNEHDDLWFDLGISTEKNKICIMVLNIDNFFENYIENYNKLCELINNKKSIIKGIDLDIENKATLSNTIKFISDIKRDYPNLLLALSVIGYSMCVKDINTKYENEKEWSYSLFNKMKAENYIDYYNCQLNEDDFTMDSFEDMINNGFNASKLVIGYFLKFSKKDF